MRYRAVSKDKLVARIFLKPEFNLNTMTNVQTVKKGDFVELKFTGLVDGRVFDSNIKEDLAKLDEKATVEKTVVIVGQGMLVSGFDNFLEGKEVGKFYELALTPSNAYGPRRKELVRVIPIKIFHEQKIQPQAGASFVFDGQLAKVIAVSSSRVTTDFNNPLAGKDVVYKFSISSIVTDLKEKTETVCKLLFRFAPKVTVENDVPVVHGPVILETFIKQTQNKFKEFLGREVHFKAEEAKKEEAKEISN